MEFLILYKLVDLKLSVWKVAHYNLGKSILRTHKVSEKFFKLLLNGKTKQYMANKSKEAYRKLMAKWLYYNLLNYGEEYGDL